MRLPDWLRVMQGLVTFQHTTPVILLSEAQKSPGRKNLYHSFILSSGKFAVPVPV